MADKTQNPTQKTVAKAPKADAAPKAAAKGKAAKPEVTGLTTLGNLRPQAGSHRARKRRCERAKVWLNTRAVDRMTPLRDSVASDRSSSCFRVFVARTVN